MKYNVEVFDFFPLVISLYLKHLFIAGLYFLASMYDQFSTPMFLLHDFQCKCIVHSVAYYMYRAT